MVNVDAEVELWRREADVDFTGLWHIASSVEDDLSSSDQELIRQYTLEIVRGLMERGVYPGDYTLENLKTTGFLFWPGEPDEHLKRIEAEWIVMGKTPTVLDSICWFALRPTAVA